jgi:hypothetical protein
MCKIIAEHIMLTIEIGEVLNLLSIQLDRMSFEEKITAVELLWDDICHKESEFQSPDWHEAVLKEREQRIIDGKDILIDWEEAKKSLRQSSK